MATVVRQSDSDMMLHLVELRDHPARTVERHARQSALAPSEGLTGDALLTTKLYLPHPRHDLVHRGRLIERMSDALARPLTLIVAPAGYGKTALLGEWCATRHDNGLSTAWLTLDAEDNDLARFLRYLVAALQTVHAEIGRATLEALRAPQPPPVDVLLTPLLNDLAVLPEHVVVILDDYHLIESPPIHRAMAFMLEHLPPQVHMVLAARADPPVPLARLRARGRLTELRAADLRFTSEETTAFLAGTMGLHLQAETVARLEHCTEGWVAALQLAALALQRSDPEPIAEAIAASTRANRYILDYLADEVFNLQPESVRRFLLHTAVLDRLSGGLCDALVGEAAGGTGREMLEQLEAANLFLIPLDGARTWYRYHQLFAGFLRRRLRREHPELVPELHRRAAQWLEEQGAHVAAADHALAAADYGQAARLIEQVITPIIWRRGELATLQRWLRQLPREVAGTRPRLCLDLAWVLLWSAQVDEVESRLQDADRALAAGESAGEDARAAGRALYGEIAAIRAELARRRGDLNSAIDLARRALADLPETERRVRSVTSGLLAGAYLWSGDAEAASRAYADVVAFSQEPDTVALALIGSGRLVQTQVLAGRLHEASETYERTLRLATDAGMPELPAIGVAQVGMADALREWNDLAAAEGLARQGIARCAEWEGLAEMALEGCLTLARVAQARGDTQGAETALREAEAIGREGQVAQYAEWVGVARARLWLTALPGDPAAAARWASGREDAWRMDESYGYLGLLERVTYARLCLAQGRGDAAATLLRRLLVAAEAGSLTGCLIEILVLQSRLLQEQDYPAQAMVALTRALRLAEPAGYLRIFMDEGAPMVTLLRQAQARGVAPAYVGALLAACGAASSRAITPAVPMVVQSLSAREQELIQLLAAGLSTSEIAAQLFITVGTVRNHLKSIFGKLDAHSRLQAVERARALSLI